MRGPALVQGRLVFPLSRLTTVVGRRDRAANSIPDVDLELFDHQRLVSRRHAEVRYRAGRLHVVDVGSSNGVMVNGERLPPLREHALTDGDVVTFGGVTLAFEEDVAWPQEVVAEWLRPNEPAEARTNLDRTSTFSPGIIGQIAPAIHGGEFLLFYQPKVTLSSGRIDAVEALIRWQHPTLGLLGPADFLAQAEETALIRALTRVAFAAGVRQGRAWLDDGLEVSVCVNLAVQDLEDPQFATFVARLLDEAELTAGRLTAEITETGVMARPARALETLQSLRSLGVGVGIDDFGIGQSSLSYLKRLPATELKIDQSFCAELDEDDVVIVRSTVELGHSMGLTVTAEGVEREQAVDTLRSLGCDAAQGYLFGRPMPAEEMTARLRSQEGRAPS